MREDGPAADPGEWYVAFYSGNHRWWWEFGDEPGFGHCMAFSYSVLGECWTIYDVTRDRTYVRCYPRDVFLDWFDSLPFETRVLKVATQPSARTTFRFGFWCTVAVKHLLGIPSRALRPKALYRDLLAMGAEFAFATGPHDGSQGQPAA